ncbi:MAG: dephospho-CoA kinase [Nitriliruptoraceae bacterium]|nr:dephospho-CoA kinase [Nitriliruptoraceae bacterium]
MYLIGLTGGMGSGKSTAAARFAYHGAVLIDADGVAREIVAVGEPVLADLAARFGTDILRPDGSLDRTELARRAFVDDASRSDLNAITHPRIAGRIATRIAELEGEVAPDALVVVDHPLLIETGQVRRFDAVVVVVADERRRVRRLVEQRGMDEADVRARIGSQVTDDERRAVASHVLDNDGSREELEARIDALVPALRAEAARVAGQEAATHRENRR